MKVWILQPSEILPIKENSRLMRMGLLGEELSNNNHDVVWFTSSFDHFKKKQLFNSDTEYLVKNKYYLKILYAKGYKKNISIARILNHKVIGIKLKRQIKKETKPDIIFVSFPTVEFAEVAVKYGKKYHVPVVVDVRDLWPDIFNHNLHGLLKILSIPYVFYLNQKVKKILANCYKITSISDLMLDWGLKKGKKNKSNLDKSFYIGYKSDIEEIKEIGKYKYLFNNNTFNICFFATINNQFNYNLIIEIAKRLKNDDVNIIICGNGPQFKYLQNKSRTVGNIILLDWCDKETLQYILSRSNIGFAPYNNTFDFQMSVSNKFCEYLSFGLPVLITCSGYMESILNKYKIGLASCDVEKIRNFILKLLKNKNYYQKMRLQAREVYNKYFNAEKIYPSMVKYLENVKEEYYK